jgi:hypothetical protein
VQTKRYQENVKQTGNGKMSKENKEEEIEFFDCDQCGGTGWVIMPDHHPSCNGNCTHLCPVPVQAPCDKCGGAGCFPIPKDKDANNI